MTDNVLWLDIESTGLDTSRDRIVELCLYPHGGLSSTYRLNPGVPIPAEASAVHGITDADVADCPRFAEIAAEVQAMTTGKILGHYNGRSFDTLMLDAELRRAGQPGLARDAAGRLAVPEIDLFRLWSHLEPRTLAGAVRRFCDLELEDAHSAAADTEVLPAILDAMVSTYLLHAHTPEELCAMCVPEGEVDRDGKFVRRDDGVIVFNFGKHKGQPVHSEPGFLTWMVTKDFSAETLAYARQFIRETGARGRR